MCLLPCQYWRSGQFWLQVRPLEEKNQICCLVIFWSIWQNYFARSWQPRERALNCIIIRSGDMVPFFFVYFGISNITFIQNIYPSPVPFYLLVARYLSTGKTSMGCQAKNWTWACLKASRRTTNWATPYPNWATSHPTELRHRIF